MIAEWWMKEEYLSHDRASGIGALEIEVSADTVAAEARVRGELDIATIDRMQTALSRLRADGYRRITLELSDLRFLSASGLGMLVREADELERAGRVLVLRNPTPAVRRALAVARLEALVSP